MHPEPNAIPFVREVADHLARCSYFKTLVQKVKRQKLGGTYEYRDTITSCRRHGAILDICLFGRPDCPTCLVVL